ncbi:MAG: hypothetical protein L6Q72_18060 [Burkholderiaceae bacterium]|nr:hypothetical protein [Burkholderiaceae bacterium]
MVQPAVDDGEQLAARLLDTDRASDIDAGVGRQIAAQLEVDATIGRQPRQPRVEVRRDGRRDRRDVQFPRIAAVRYAEATAQVDRAAPKSAFFFQSGRDAQRVA